VRYGIGSVTASIYDAMVTAIAQPAMPLIGVLSNTSPAARAGAVAAFHRGLGEDGYVEGRNVALAFRWAENQYDRLPSLAWASFVLVGPSPELGHVEKPIDKHLPWAQPIRAVMQFVA
jgi:hypothetical protein